jgi:Zn-dependent protease
VNTPRLPVEPVRPGDQPAPTVDRMAAARAAAIRRGGISLGAPYGVPVRVSVLGLGFSVAFAVIWFSPYAPADGSGLSTSQLWQLVILGALLLELSVLLHEIAHCFVAKRMGLRVGALRLVALGGVSEIEVETRSPRREAAVAMAGPIVSVLLAAGFSALFLELNHSSTALPSNENDPFLLLTGWLALLNTGLAVFNLLPGLPLDGGRILRAAIWGATGRAATGTRIAGFAGYLVAAAAFLTALRGSTGYALYGALIAGYIAVNARGAIYQAGLGERAQEVQIGSLTRKALRVAADTPLAEAIRRAKASGSRAMVVIDVDGSPQAIASDDAIDAVPEQRRPWVPVSSVCRPLVAGLILDTRLAGSAALAAMRSQPSGEYLVVSPDGAVLGVLATVDVAGVLTPGRRA